MTDKQKLLNVLSAIWALASLFLSEIYYDKLGKNHSGLFMRFFILGLFLAPAWVMYAWRYLADKKVMPGKIFFPILALFIVWAIISLEVKMCGGSGYYSRRCGDETVIFAGVAFLFIHYFVDVYPQKPLPLRFLATIGRYVWRKLYPSERTKKIIYGCLLIFFGSVFLIILKYSDIQLGFIWGLIYMWVFLWIFQKATGLYLGFGKDRSTTSSKLLVACVKSAFVIAVLFICLAYYLFGNPDLANINSKEYWNDAKVLNAPNRAIMATAPKAKSTDFDWDSARPFCPVNIPSEDPFCIIQLPYGISIDIPSDWKILSQKTRQNIVAFSKTLLKNRNIESSGGKKENLLAVNAAPSPHGAMIRVSVTTLPNFTQEDLAALTPSELKQMQSELHAMFNNKNMGFKILVIQPIRIEKINNQLALVIDYTRTSLKDANTWQVIQYKVPVAHRLIEVTLSHRESDAATWDPILKYVKNSIRF